MRLFFCHNSSSRRFPEQWANPGALPADALQRPRRAAPGSASLQGSARPKEGEQGELAFLSKASSLGFALSLPYGHMQRYDFVVDSGGNMWRVQVKTTNHMLNGLYLVGISSSRQPQARTPTPSPKSIS